MHLKRQEIPKNWPVHRKGTKYVIRPSSDLASGVPVLIFMRDMLEMVQNRKELKRAIHQKNILLNGKPVRDERASILLFDVIAIVPSKKYYKLGLKTNGKLEVQEVKENEAQSKFSKIVNKKMMRGKKTQINLLDGNNFLSEIKCNTGDSVLVDFKDRKIEKCVPLGEKSKILIFAGKHAGKTGQLEKIDKENQVGEVDIEGKPISVLIKQMMAVE